MGWTVKRGNSYQARYRDADGRTRAAGTFARKSDAQKAADQAGINLHEDKETLTWTEWKPIWWASRTVEPGTLARDQLAIDKHVEPRWGEIRLDEIAKHDVQLWVTELRKTGLAATTVAKLRNILSGSLRAAVDAEEIDTNPCQGVKLPKAGPSPDRFLTPEECDAIRKFLPPDQQFLFDLLLGTGMRFGEALGLHWEDVDCKSDKPTVTVYWSWDRVDRSMKAPKSNQSRTIPISAALAGALKAKLAEDGWGEPLLVEYRGSRKPHSGVVIASRNETEWMYGWRAAVKVATVGTGKDKRKVGSVRTHDLRHTYASRRVQSGTELQVVKDLLGHSTITLTERYARLAPNKFDDVRKHLD